MKKLLSLLIIFILFGMLHGQDSLLVRAKALDEVSGIVCSAQNPGMYYVINDSGGKPEVYGLNSKGELKAILQLSDIINRDWEDIAIGPGPLLGRYYLYVGEIGDNAAKYPEVWLYRFIEPMLHYDKAHGKKQKTLTFNFVEKLKIQYSDGAKDCEALFVDSQNGDVYLISKREEKVGLYVVTAPLNPTLVNIARRIMSFDFPLAVAADISLQRDKILVKTYTDIYKWDIQPEETILHALSGKYTKLPYHIEPQGESICFSADGSKYVTISESLPKTLLYMYIYPLTK